LPVHDPARAEVVGRVAVATAAEVGAAVEAAHEAFLSWRRVPVTERIQPLFRLQMILVRDFEALAQTITLECGKTLAENRGEMRRAIENVETAAGMPYLQQTGFNENIAAGIDELSIRQPLGVAALEVGLAFGNASVALVHGMSRPLGGLFHIPHGLSNAVLLPAVTRFSFTGNPGRYGEIARMMGVAPTVEALASGSPENHPVAPTAAEMAAPYWAAWFVN
jgi:hypothetical protein